MSRDPLPTRARILEATLELIESGAVNPSMSMIAKTAGLSRQALYLTFADRGELLIAALRYADGQRGLVEGWARIRRAKSGRSTFRAIVELQANLCPAYKRLAAAFDILRREDAAAEAAWQDRQADRLAGCLLAAERLARDQQLKPDITVEIAAEIIWALTSSSLWDDLVSKRGWRADAYKRHLETLLGAILAAPPSASLDKDP